ncbi:MAG: phosphonate metabolism protein/1,5-bisphosphokinase (PRPP-forming) PhnN [Betaproteobacteria bacterium]|nr:phosphonate metabolism protein/1,5-bisphosphokinase (PRPP-forming) PhnN [Betaproteobacteria bacterium]
MSNAQPGKLFYVIGPSGSGKDSLMKFARSRLGAVKKIIFAHRYITRLPEMQGENHIYLSHEEFENRKNQGFFSMYWESHDLSYGIGCEINLWLTNGYDVVINGSRAYLSSAVKIYPEMQVIFVSTSTDVLRNRLLKRNRETPEEIEKRLHRASMQCNIEYPHLITLNNDTDLAQSGAAFINLLTNSDGIRSDESDKFLP